MLKFLIVEHRVFVGDSALKFEPTLPINSV